MAVRPVRLGWDGNAERINLEIASRILRACQYVGRAIDVTYENDIVVAVVLSISLTQLHKLSDALAGVPASSRLDPARSTCKRGPASSLPFGWLKITGRLGTHNLEAGRASVALPDA